MKISDVLRKLADLADQQSNPARPDPSIQNPADLEQVPAGPYGEEVDMPSVEDVEDNVFLPPLQQKQELLKRAVEVNNVYDNEYSEETHPDSALNLNNSNKELDAIKKNAGLTGALFGMSDDEPLDQ